MISSPPAPHFAAFAPPPPDSRNCFCRRFSPRTALSLPPDHSTRHDHRPILPRPAHNSSIMPPADPSSVRMLECMSPLPPVCLRTCPS
jgi:hypothetical protein